MPDIPKNPEICELEQKSQLGHTVMAKGKAGRKDEKTTHRSTREDYVAACVSEDMSSPYAHYLSPPGSCFICHSMDHRIEKCPQLPYNLRNALKKANKDEKEV